MPSSCRSRIERKRKRFRTFAAPIRVKRPTAAAKIQSWERIPPTTRSSSGMRSKRQLSSISSKRSLSPP